MKRNVSVALIAVFLLQNSPAFAVSARDVDPGDIVYIDGGLFSDNEMAHVVRVDGNRIKVRRADGSTEWFESGTVYTKNEIERKDTTRGIGVLLGIGLGAAAIGSASSQNSSPGHR